MPKYIIGRLSKPKQSFVISLVMLPEFSCRSTWEVFPDRHTYLDITPERIHNILMHAQYFHIKLPAHAHVFLLPMHKVSVQYPVSHSILRAVLHRIVCLLHMVVLLDFDYISDMSLCESWWEEQLMRRTTEPR